MIYHGTRIDASEVSSVRERKNPGAGRGEMGGGRVG